jgi:hypothetical protein
MTIISPIEVPSDEPLYLPLPTPASVRLLRVERDAASRIIHGTLETWDLDDPSCPSYVTLSYSWGAPSRGCAIWLKGRIFPVLDTVYPILEAICDGPGHSEEPAKDGEAASSRAPSRTAATSGFDRKADGWYWIDSICINQDDLDERSAQVKLMGRLYCETARAAVWLGPSDPFSDMAMDLFAELRERLGELEARSASSTAGADLLPKSDPLMDERRWEAWSNLLQNRGWWRRVWTLQEFVLPMKLDFHCGPAKRISREQWSRGMSARKYLPFAGGEYGRPGSDDSAWLAAWHRRRIFQWHRQAMDRPEGWIGGIGPKGTDLSLAALLAYTADASTSVPHDRMYALRGLLSDSETKSLLPVVDYKMPIEELLYEFAKRWIETYKSLDIICFAEHFLQHGAFLPRAGDPGSRDVPPRTWIPDWRQQGISFVVPLMVSQTAGNHIGNFRPIRDKSMQHAPDPVRYQAFTFTDHPFRVRFSDEHRALVTEGYMIGRCSNNEHESTEPPAQNKSAADLKISVLLSVINNLLRCMVLDREDRYLTRPADMVRYRAEFLALADLGFSGTIPEGTSAPVAWLLAWLHRNAGLDVGGGLTLREVTSSVLARLHVHGSDVKVGQLTDRILMTGVDETGLAARMYDTTHPNRMHKELFSWTPLGGSSRHFRSFAMGPSLRPQLDYEIWILRGCSVPVVLGPVGWAVEGGKSFVGECYLDGYMNGEFVPANPEPDGLWLL